MPGLRARCKCKRSDIEQIGFVISSIKDNLERGNKYTIEAHKELVTKELTEREWIDYIE